MRTINVKTGKSKYKLKGEDGAYIGEVTIDYTSKDKLCSIDITKIGKNIEALSIEAKLNG